MGLMAHTTSNPKSSLKGSSQKKKEARFVIHARDTPLYSDHHFYQILLTIKDQDII